MQIISNFGVLIFLLVCGIYDNNGCLVVGMGLLDEQIDVDGLKVFMLYCMEKGYCFDYWLDQVILMQDLLELIVQVGLGFMSMYFGKLLVIWLCDDQLIEDVVNMVNIKWGSFCVDYQMWVFVEELVVVWFDCGDWLQYSLCIKVFGVDVLQSMVNISLIGVGSEFEVVFCGCFIMVQNIFQWKFVIWEMDLEYLNY